jgi:hypothetical protein
MRPFAAILGAKRHQTLKKLYKLLETLIDLPEPSHTVTFGRPFAAIPGAKRHQTSRTTPHTVIFGMTYIIDGPNKGAVAAPGCLKAKNTPNTTAKIIRNTSNSGLLLRPQPTVKKTPKNTPKDRNIISR